MAKGYTRPDRVAGFLGTTLTTDQIGQFQFLQDPAELLIDAIAKRSWLTGPIVAESYSMINIGINLYLRQRPVQSVERILVRSLRPGDLGVTLTAAIDYELMDPQAGRVTLSNTWSTAATYSTYENYGGSAIYSEGGTLLDQGQFSGQVALVSYTPVQTVPYSVVQATTMLIAQWLLYNIHPERFGLTEARTADQQETLSAASAAGIIPPGVYEVLDRDVTTLHL